MQSLSNKKANNSLHTVLATNEETMSTIIIPILTALVGGFVAYYFGVKAKRDEAIYKYKEEKYAKLLLSLQGFVGETANAKTKNHSLMNNTSLGCTVPIGRPCN